MFAWNCARFALAAAGHAGNPAGSLTLPHIVRAADGLSSRARARRVLRLVGTRGRSAIRGRRRGVARDIPPLADYCVSGSAIVPGSRRGLPENTSKIRNRQPNPPLPCGTALAIARGQISIFDFRHGSRDASKIEI